MRHTRSHTKNRRSHHALKETGIVTDKDTGNLRLPHRLDEATGMYRGKQIVSAKEKKVKGKTEKKVKETKGVDTTPSAKKHEKSESKGLLGRMSRGNAKSRSGLGAES